MKKYFSIFIFLLLLLASCEKENKQEAEFLYNKTWKVGITDKNSSSNPQGSITYHAPRQCDLDDIYTFYKSGSQLVINKGNDKCSFNESNQETMYFSIDANRKVLIIGNESFILADFSDSQIKYYKPVPSGYLVYLLQ